MLNLEGYGYSLLEGSLLTINVALFSLAIALVLGMLGALAKLEAGDVHLDLRPVDLVALIERVVARHGSVAASHGVVLEHGVPPEPLLYLIAFGLFRLFDVSKLYPVNRLQDLPGGWGIMLDDIGAGIYTLLIMQIIIYFW